MSRDIRSFFSPKNDITTKVSQDPEVAKRRAIVLSSDDDEEVERTPKLKIKPKTKGPKKRRIIESDEEDKSPIKNKKPNLSKLKDELTLKYKKPSAEEIQAKFGHVPIRVEKRKILTSTHKLKENDSINKNDNTISLEDDEFNESLININESKLITENDKTSDTVASKFFENELSKKSLIKSIQLGSEKNENDQLQNDRKETNKPSKETISSNEIKIESSTKKIEITVKKSLDNISIESETKKTPKSKSIKKVDLNSSALSDEDRHERKRMAAMLYQKYKNRSGAINPGSKEIPKGKPNCLAGLTFVVTGILESMERDEAIQVIKDFSGKISATVGKRVNYMVVGEEAGPKKIVTAEELGVKVISEDELFNLIREKSGEKPFSNNVLNKSPKEKIKIREEIKGEMNIKTDKLNAEFKVKQNKSEDNKSENKDKFEQKRKTNDAGNFDSEIKMKKEKLEFQVKKEDKKKIKEKAIKVEISPKKCENIETKQENMDMLPWVEKYKPINLKQIIGQQGGASNCIKLQNWLSKWYINHDGKKKLQKPNPWAKNDDGSFYKAALLSGPPGVGKTTTAHLVCKELDFDIVEFNASDTRSKRLLKEEVSELLSNKSLYGYFNGKTETVSKKHVLIMDEVDGMAGNEDRGGVSELISLIKDSSVPIICMCNDRNHQKMRSLTNYCYDLRFNKPRLEQIRGPIMTICFKEKFKLSSEKVDEIIAATNNDIRQTLNHLSLLAGGNGSILEVSNKDKTAKKDLKLGPWDVVRKVFTKEDQTKMTIHDKSDLFFNDYSLGPLFVQQNYLQVSPSGPRDKVPERVALAADSLSLGDLIDRRIRSNSAWTLLPIQAMFSSVMPGEYMSGHFVGQINFPSWLGKYSKSNKRKRFAQELHDHTRIRTSGSRLSIRQDYAPFLLDGIVRPLKEKGLEGVTDALKVMKEYRLLREDVDYLIELTTWPGRKNTMDFVDGKVKAAFTRAYNKEGLAYSYSATVNVKKKKADKMDDITEFEGEDGDNCEAVAIQSDNEDDDDNLENDALIKSKKKPTPKTGSSQETKPDFKKVTNKGKGKK